MDKNKRAMQRKELFERINEEFTQDYVASIYQDEEESGMPDGVLNVYFEDMGNDLEDVIGQFFFSGSVTDDDPVQTFNCLMGLTEDIDESVLPELFEAMSYINYYCYTGHFAVGEDHDALMYRLCLPLPSEMDDEDLYRHVQLAIGNSVMVVDNFVELLLDIVHGDKGVKDVRERIEQVAASIEWEQGQDQDK